MTGSRRGLETSYSSTQDRASLTSGASIDSLISNATTWSRSQLQNSFAATSTESFDSESLDSLNVTPCSNSTLTSGEDEPKRRQSQHLYVSSPSSQSLPCSSCSSPITHPSKTILGVALILENGEDKLSGWIPLLSSLFEESLEIFQHLATTAYLSVSSSRSSSGTKRFYDLLGEFSQVLCRDLSSWVKNPYIVSIPHLKGLWPKMSSMQPVLNDLIFLLVSNDCLRRPKECKVIVQGTGRRLETDIRALLHLLKVVIIDRQCKCYRGRRKSSGVEEEIGQEALGNEVIEIVNCSKPSGGLKEGEVEENTNLCVVKEDSDESSSDGGGKQHDSGVGSSFNSIPSNMSSGSNNSSSSGGLKRIQSTKGGFDMKFEIF